MVRGLIVAFATLSILCAACSGVRPPAPTPLPGTLPATGPLRTGTMRFEMPGDADVADVPWLVAVDSLRIQGYTIETMSFSNSALGVTAIAEGDLDVASFSNQVLWSAIDKGVPLITIMDTSANTFMAITRQEIQTCADLDGKSVAIPTVSAVSGVMFNAYVDKNCPGVEAETLIISGGSNRRVALLTGAVDVALQDVDDWIRIEEEAPGRFHPLAVFSQEFPGVWINSLAAHRDFAQEHPEMLKDVIRALFIARRNLQDPQALSEAIIRYLELDPDEAEQAAEVYLAQGIWDARGTYTLETVQVTIDFLQTFGDLPPGLKAEDVADLSYYDAVLAEIGRQ